MKINNQGFSTATLLALVAVIGAVSATGWYVSQSNTENQTRITELVQDQSETQKAPTDTMVLAGETVIFEYPENWVKSDGVGCVEGAPIFGNEKLLDSVELLANKKPKNSTEPNFSVSICVFDNPRMQTPQEWANSTDGGASIGYPSDNDITSEESINGNTAYHIKFTAEEHGGNEDLYYIISSGKKIAYVSSRIMYDFTGPEHNGEEYEPYGGKVYDFREYELAVKEVVNSITIK